MSGRHKAENIEKNVRENENFVRLGKQTDIYIDCVFVSRSYRNHLEKQILWLWQRNGEQKKCAREFIPCDHMQMRLDHSHYQFPKLEGIGHYVGNRRGMEVNRFRRRLKILKKTITI